MNAAFSPPTAAINDSGGMMANSIPTLFADGTALYLAWENSYGTATLSYSTDGTHFTYFTGNNWIAGPTFSPSIAVNPSNGTMYVAYSSGSTYTPVLCTANTSNHILVGCQNSTGLRTMNFNPSIAFYNGLLYLGFEDRGDSHCLYFYKYTPSSNSYVFWDPTSCGEQTSTTPSLATHNGYLYVAFRSNDDSKKFTERVSTTGNDLGTREQPGFSMDGPPNLYDLKGPANAAVLMESHAKSGVMTVSNGTP